jgi:hypothetical protein
MFSRRRPGRLRIVLLSFTLAAAGTSGWAAAAYTASASGGLLPTTISVPSLPISVSTISVPTLTLGGSTTTTVTVATTAGSATVTAPERTSEPPTSTQTSTSVADPPAKTAAGDGIAIAGAVRLASGQISVPVSSVTRPVHLVVTPVLVTPSTIRTKAARLVVLLQVSDTRGYLVRGAVIHLTSKPLHAFVRTSLHKTGATGLARFTLVTSAHLALNPHTAVTITARVATTALRIRVPVNPRR